MKTWLGLRLAPVPGLSSSGDQVLGERLLSYHLPRPSRSVFWVYNCVCLFWGADLWLRPSVDVSHPESQEVLVSNWEAA